MKLAICLPTFGRLGCLERCLASIASNREAAEADVLLYPDLVTDEELEQQHDVFKRFRLNGGIRERPPQRLYSSGNGIRSITTSIADGYDRVVFLESDLTLSPYYLKQVLAAMDWSSVPCQSGIVSDLTPEMKRVAARQLVGMSSGSNFAFTADHWKTIEPWVVDYTDLFLKARHPYVWDRGGCLDWYAEKVKDLPPDPSLDDYRTGRVGNSSDGTMLFAMVAKGIRPYCLYVNRAIVSTEPGMFSDPQSLIAFGATKLDIIEEDATRTDFTIYQ